MSSPSQPSALRRRFLGWTILERSCELAQMAHELGDGELEKRFRACALRVAPIVDVSPELVTRIDRVVEHRRR